MELSFGTLAPLAVSARERKDTEAVGECQASSWKYLEKDFGTMLPAVLRAKNT